MYRNQPLSLPYRGAFSSENDTLLSLALQKVLLRFLIKHGFSCVDTPRGEVTRAGGEYIQPIHVAAELLGVNSGESMDLGSVVGHIGGCEVAGCPGSLFSRCFNRSDQMIRHITSQIFRKVNLLGDGFGGKGIGWFSGTFGR